MQRDDVGLPEDVVHAVAAFDAELLRLLGRERAGPGDDAQPEGARAGDDLAPDLAGADHAERLAEDAVGLGELLLVPLVGAQGGDVLRDAAVNGQQQGEHQLRHGDRVLAGAVADEDAPGAGGLDVNGVDARAGAQHQGQLVGGFERLGGDLFAAHDQDLERPDQPGQFLGFGGWLIGDFAAELVKALDVGSRRICRQ